MGTRPHGPSAELARYAHRVARQEGWRKRRAVGGQMMGASTHFIDLGWPLVPSYIASRSAAAAAVGVMGVRWRAALVVL